MRQHFIPQSYLKNFAFKKEKGLFLEAATNGTHAINEINIKNLCVEKDIYTIPKFHGLDYDPHSLELFYADKMDGLYPTVYEILTNPEITNIDAGTKQSIISITMSLFFRGPNFIPNDVKGWTSTFKNLYKANKDFDGNVEFNHEGYSYKFNYKQYDLQLQGYLATKKISFIKNHLNQLQKFVDFKSNAAISVERIHDHGLLITSDNPVIMRSPDGELHDVFSPENIIHLPLDPKHYLTIYPNTQETMGNVINRSIRDFAFSLTINHDIQKNSIRWLLGNLGHVQKHLDDQIKYNDPTGKDGQELLFNMRERGLDAERLGKLIDKNGGVLNEEIANFMRDLMKKEIHRSDPNMVKKATELNNLGFNVI